MSLPEDYQPAVRDPKKLVRTAWVLVGVMLLGGWLVLKAYEKWAIKQSSSNRPSIVHRIVPERSLRVIRQDGTTADLLDLRGKVFVLQVVDFTNLTTSARSSAVMKRIADAYAQNPHFHLVTLRLDPLSADQVVSELAKSAEAQGMKLPQWWLATNEPHTLQTFIRKELKPSGPAEWVDGKWVFDASIVLIDKNGHLRRAVVPQQKGGPPFVANFDFDQAAKWDVDGIKTGTDNSNEAQLEFLLKQTIDQLLDESYQP